jgi:3',5'-cyclic AMP phosphodiesterase CpdA
MRTIAHISDIHFGMVDPATVEPLADAVREMAPDVVAISGDLTQRARRSQFRKARELLDRLPYPQIVVPGNHDVPLYNLLDRFFRPLANYRRYISGDLEPFFVDGEIAVLGINTARSLAFKNGRISREQIGRIRQRLCAIDDRIVKILVTHHPLDLPRGFYQEELVGRADVAMEVLAACGADLLLAGHYHLSHTGDTAARYPIPGFTALVVHAGTATSTRGRGEPNSFNVIRIQMPIVTVHRFIWRQELQAFGMFREERFEKSGNGWESRSVAAEHQTGSGAVIQPSRS